MTNKECVDRARRSIAWRASMLGWCMLAAALPAAALPSAGAAPAAAPTILVRDAWVRETMPTGRTSAAYVTIENRGATALTLTGITVAGAARAELHEIGGTAMAATMRPVASMTVPARDKLVLAPGGSHVMLFDVNPPFVPGRSVKMTLSFDGQPPQTIQAIVRPLAATSVR